MGRFAPEKVEKTGFVPVGQSEVARLSLWLSPVEQVVQEQEQEQVEQVQEIRLES